MGNVHPHLVIRYGEAISHALLPAQSATATITFRDDKALQQEASLMVGPDGAAWMWFATSDVDCFARFVARDPTATIVAVSGVLADGRQFQAGECYFANIDMHGTEGAVRHDVTGWNINLVNPAEFTVLLRVVSELQVRAGDPIADECQVEYTLLNAVFEGTEWTQYDGGRSRRADAFAAKTAARKWTIRGRREFYREERAALDLGAVAFLPTATASTQLLNADSLASADAEAHVICFLMSLATGAATRWTARCVCAGEKTEWIYAGYRPTTGVRNRKFNELISNHEPLRGLETLLNECVDAYQRARGRYRLDRAIGFLEEARVQQVADVQLVLAILAVESLTYYWCLDNGLNHDQLKAMSIETKLNRMAKTYPGIEPKILKTDLLRSDVRNPLMHMGEIPAMTVDEMLLWAERLYVLAFRILLTLVGYSGEFVDITRSRSKTVASIA